MSGLGDLAELWVSAIWRAGWQGGLAALVAWAVCRLVPSLPARFQAWLWRLVMVKFAVTFLWASPLALPLLPAPVTSAVLTLPVSAAAETGAERVAGVRSEARGILTPSLAGFLAWSVVVSCQVLLILRSCRAASRLKRNAHATRDRALLGQLATVGRSFGAPIPPVLLEAEGDGSPMLIGILRPAIVIPRATLVRLDDRERATVLGHEIAHLRRGDLCWGLLAALVRAVFFYHPLAWLAERRLRSTQEIAADELAVSRQCHDRADYAALLISVVSKLGSRCPIPAMSVGAVGSCQSLKQRVHAMHFLKPLSRRAVAAYALTLGLVAGLGIVPWTVVAAEPPAADKAAPKTVVNPKGKNAWGRFVSFNDGKLTIQNNAGELVVWDKVPDDAKLFSWNLEANGYKPVEGGIGRLKQLEANTWVVVSGDAGTIRVGSRKDKTSGTFVSFKEGRLLMLGKNLGENFTKKYGNNLHFNRFRDDVPVYESIDGGEFKLVGMANKVLADVKEGMVLTVHSEGDDNITRVDIGTPKAK